MFLHLFSRQQNPPDWVLLNSKAYCCNECFKPCTDIQLKWYWRIRALMSAYPFTRAYLPAPALLSSWCVARCFDALTDTHRTRCHACNLFIFSPVSPSRQLYFLGDGAVTEAAAASQFRREVRLGDAALVLSPHQRTLLNLCDTYRTCTLPCLTLLTLGGEHNQSLPWILTPALCCCRGEENREFMQSQCNT